MNEIKDVVKKEGSGIDRVIRKYELLYVEQLLSTSWDNEEVELAFVQTFSQLVGV